MKKRAKLWLLVPAALLAGALTLSSCSTLPPLEGRVASTALTDTDNTRSHSQAWYGPVHLQLKPSAKP